MGDRTSFDTYIEGTDDGGRVVRVGIEVKYTNERYIDCLDGGSEIKDWKAFLQDVYLVSGPA